jgi:hypothetical protein
MQVVHLMQLTIRLLLYHEAYMLAHWTTGTQCLRAGRQAACRNEVQRHTDQYVSGPEEIKEL